MPQEYTEIVFLVVLTFVVACGGAFIFHFMKAQKAQEALGKALTAQSIMQSCSEKTHSNPFLFSVLQNGNSFSNMYLLVRDQHNAHIATIHFPRMKDHVMREIEHEGRIYQCWQESGVLKNRVSLRHQDEVLLSFEANVTDEHYYIQNDVRYKRSLFKGGGTAGWPILSNDTPVAHITNLKHLLNIHGQLLVLKSDMPVIEQLFILTMSYRLSDAG